MPLNMNLKNQKQKQMKILLTKIKYYLIAGLAGIFKNPALLKKKLIIGGILAGLLLSSSCGLFRTKRTCYVAVPADYDEPEKIEEHDSNTE